MNEIFDKLILRLFLALFICGSIVFYRYIHSFLYPSSVQAIFKRFHPTKNSAETIHIFSRIVGLSILFSEFYFYISQGIFYALVDFTILATLGVITYIISIYVIESIAFYEFEYHDEIIKRKNNTYAFMSGTNAICVGYLLKSILAVSHDSPVILLFLWLFALVLIGITTKVYSMISSLSFRRLVLQKNMNIAISYFGFMWGWTLVISHTLNNNISNIRFYIIQVILKIILCMILIPLFEFGISYVFKIQDKSTQLFGIPKDASEDYEDSEDLGRGVFEGSLFFVCAYLAVVVTNNINFGTFYPLL